MILFLSSNSIGFSHQMCGLVTRLLSFLYLKYSFFIIKSVLSLKQLHYIDRLIEQ